MTEPKPFDMAKLFTQLVGKDVKFSLFPHPAVTKIRQIYGTYSVVRTGREMVVKADLPMVAALGAALIGLPPELGAERALQTPMDESMRDAIHEVLNIASTVISPDERVTFTSFVLDPIYCKGEASEILKKPDVKINFRVVIDNGTPGTFTILRKN